MAVSIQELRNTLPSPELVASAINEIQAFELLQRKAKMYASATMVPERFAGNLGNCAIAVQMADQMKMPIITVMQSLYIVHGSPAWSSAFLIGCVNASGRFESLRYEWKGKPGTPEYGCRAWTIEKSTGERLDGTWIDWAMVTSEGWDKKNGSKWKTMPEQMFRYRAGAFWQRAYAPEIALGLDTVEERRDVLDITPEKPVTLAEVATGIREDKTINPSTGEITTPAPEVTQANHPGEPPAVSVATLIKRLNACKDVDAAGIIMTEPDVDELNAEDAATLMAAYRAKFGKA